MNVVLVATALAVVAGAIVALSARDARLVLPGLAVSLVLAPLVANPLPDAAPFVARLAAALLALELLWIGVRSREGAVRRHGDAGGGRSDAGRRGSDTIRSQGEADRNRTDTVAGSFVGWPALALAAAAAAVAGYTIASGPGIGGMLLQDFGTAVVTPVPEARAAGFALVAVSLAPVLFGRDAYRMAVGVLLLVTAAELVRTGVVGPAGGLEHLLVAGVTIGLALVVAATGASGSGEAETGPERIHPAAALDTGPQARPR